MSGLGWGYGSNSPGEVGLLSLCVVCCCVFRVVRPSGSGRYIGTWVHRYYEVGGNSKHPHGLGPRTSPNSAGRRRPALRRLPDPTSSTSLPCRLVLFPPRRLAATPPKATGRQNSRFPSIFSRSGRPPTELGQSCRSDPGASFMRHQPGQWASSPRSCFPRLRARRMKTRAFTRRLSSPLAAAPVLASPHHLISLGRPGPGPSFTLTSDEPSFIRLASSGLHGPRLARILSLAPPCLLAHSLAGRPELRMPLTASCSRRCPAWFGPASAALLIGCLQLSSRSEEAPRAGDPSPPTPPLHRETERQRGGE